MKNALKVWKNVPQQTTQVYRIKKEKIFQKPLFGIINLFVSAANLFILEISQKRDFFEWGI